MVRPKSARHEDGAPKTRTHPSPRGSSAPSVGSAAVERTRHSQSSLTETEEKRPQAAPVPSRAFKLRAVYRGLLSQMAWSEDDVKAALRIVEETPDELFEDTFVEFGDVFAKLQERSTSSNEDMEPAAQLRKNVASGVTCPRLGASVRIGEHVMIKEQVTESHILQVVGIFHYSQLPLRAQANWVRAAGCMFVEARWLSVVGGADGLFEKRRP